MAMLLTIYDLRLTNTVESSTQFPEDVEVPACSGSAYMYMQNSEVKSGGMHVTRVQTWMALRSCCYHRHLYLSRVLELSYSVSTYTALQYTFDLSLPSASGKASNLNDGSLMLSYRHY